jgi:hypothetical protein
MADADPLGVDMNVTFDDVGGLDNRTSFSPYTQLLIARVYRYQPVERDGSITTALPRALPAIWDNTT